jgi:hypothetical protein
MENSIQTSYSVPTTTAISKADGRLKVDVGKKKKIIKEKIKKQYGTR